MEVTQDYLDTLSYFFPSPADIIPVLSSDFSRVIRINPVSDIRLDNLDKYFDNIYRLKELVDMDEKDVFVQNPSSLLPVLALEPLDGDRVLDMCSAPGGKLTYIAELAPNADITAYEVSPDRYNRLKRFLAKRMLNINLKLGDSSKIFNKYNKYFDKVLLDAPCSSDIHQFGQGKYDFFGAKNSKKLAIKQYSLLSSAYMMLKPGGTLIYSTCTMSIYENELVIDKLLSRHDDAVLDEIPREILHLPDLKRLQPIKPLLLKHENISEKVLRVDFMDGIYEPFFVAKIKKK